MFRRPGRAFPRGERRSDVSDMGHFGRWPIRLRMVAMATSCARAQLLSECSLLITDRHALDNPCLSTLAPDGSHYHPLLRLSRRGHRDRLAGPIACVSGRVCIDAQSSSSASYRACEVGTDLHTRSARCVPVLNWLLAGGKPTF